MTWPYYDAELESEHWLVKIAATENEPMQSHKMLVNGQAETLRLLSKIAWPYPVFID